MSESEVVNEIGVIGAGAWGTALANLLADNGHRVDLWAFEKEVVQQIREHRENKLFLPNIILNDSINPSHDLKEVISGKKLLLSVVPTHVKRAIMEKCAAFVSPDAVFATASKGIENDTSFTMFDVIRESIPQLNEENIVVLSGPSFAREVALKVPTAVTVASKNIDVAIHVQHVFASDYFRVYVGDDPIGLEVGGAVKNIIAIASGFVDGMNLGLNTRAAVITRGLAEIRRLGMALGANPHTFSGLSGVGDLILTCTGNLSRNYTVGKMIGEGKSLAEIMADRVTVAEGVKNTKSVYHLSKKLGIDLPICHEVYRALYQEGTPSDAVRRLMTRELGNENSDLG